MEVFEFGGGDRQPAAALIRTAVRFDERIGALLHEHQRGLEQGAVTVGVDEDGAHANTALPVETAAAAACTEHEAAEAVRPIPPCDLLGRTPTGGKKSRGETPRAWASRDISRADEGEVGDVHLPEAPAIAGFADASADAALGEHDRLGHRGVRANGHR